MAQSAQPGVTVHQQPGQPDGPQQPLGPPGPPPWPQQVPVPPNSPPFGAPGSPYPPPLYAPQPGPSAYQYGYPPPPPGPPPRKKHTGRRVLLFLGAALVVVIVIAQLTGSGDQNQPAAGGSTGDGGGASAQPAAPASQGAQDPHRVVRDGDFAFRFLGMNCGPGAAARVYSAPGLTGHLPPGTKECLVKLRITDDKGGAQTWSASSQAAIDARGHRLSADDNLVFLGAAHENTQINPGVSITALVPYNLPRGDRIVAIELHDSAFSGGVKVELPSQS